MTAAPVHPSPHPSPRPLLLSGPQCRGGGFPARADRHRLRVRPQSDPLYPVSAGWHFVALVRKVLRLARFHERLWLSLEVAAMTTIAATLFGASAALALARGGLPGTRVITAIMLSPLMLPAILTGLALFQSYVLLDVGRPLWGLVLGHTLVSIPMWCARRWRFCKTRCPPGRGCAQPRRRSLAHLFRGDAAVDQARRHGGSRIRLHRLL